MQTATEAPASQLHTSPKMAIWLANVIDKAAKLQAAPKGEPVVLLAAKFPMLLGLPNVQYNKPPVCSIRRRRLLLLAQCVIETARLLSLLETTQVMMHPRFILST